MGLSFASIDLAGRVPRRAAEDVRADHSRHPQSPNQHAGTGRVELARAMARRKGIVREQGFRVACVRAAYKNVDSRLSCRSKHCSAIGRLARASYGEYSQVYFEEEGNRDSEQIGRAHV